jgi:hypothetical protein
MPFVLVLKLLWLRSVNCAPFDRRRGEGAWLQGLAGFTQLARRLFGG